ncbi:MAG: single-stranded-DNA-specific exonuclease [Psychrosphaera sp.]|jgi:single-stranded-DNA-specific exonuclease|uniref:Single-stranded-DNA-specific exonuclease RecJ n=1 Tax=Psychrosphaera aquimarina TaxID=2044854 RepID=A0ABU3R326_9GAMM|nr:single-stranded-DNA-specific exonuclease RecJ [Psychrosphaera aquimarina]MDU0113939.1 single-stranded-DNA-specific exonuclease RecJ [Psychrosphaera aquimarina]
MLNIKRRNTDTDLSGLAGFHPIIQKVYAGRGITHSEQIKRSAAELLPVFTMKGIDQAAALLTDALNQQLRIIIVGDFDADGATSTALMVLGLTKLGFKNVTFKVPNRFEYGYGLSPQLSQEIINQGTDLIITVDNGISCMEGVALAKNAGIKVIVTDHHLPGKALPNADAIINPNQPECEFASKNLAGVGVAFYLLLGLRSHLRTINWFQQNNVPEPNLAELLDLVALGTVADVVPLDSNNRILVHQGLARIKKGVCRPGIKAIMQLSNKDASKAKASDFGFVIGPRLNAAGRLDDMAFGIRCLLTENMGAALNMAEDLNSLNNERKEIEQGMRIEAEAAVNTISITSGNLPHGICVYEENWHQGVIGIVAGRIKDKFYRPTIAFAQGDFDANGEYELKGSARSIQGVHIRDVLDQVSTQNPGLILKFGGHAMAAGLSIKQSNLNKFKHAFDLVVLSHLSEEVLTQVTLTDGSLPSECLTKEFCQQLDLAGPWGQTFAEPTFDDKFEIINQRLVGGKHLKLVLTNDDGLVFDAIHFNSDLNVWPNPNIKYAHLVYQLDINEFRGESNLQLMIREIEPV